MGCNREHKKLMAVYYELLEVALAAQNMKATLYFTTILADMELIKENKRRSLWI